MWENIKLPIVVKKDENDTIMAYCPVFRWCHTFAENKKDLSKNIEEVVWMYFEMAKEWENVLEWDNILFLNFDKNGKITSDFSKEFNKKLILD
jgi:predicted RNase H-like HicB family nuclease